MCKGHGIYKCGKCYSCRARKRNDIMIRLTEHYRGLYRHFIQPHIAVMFGVMTFDDNFIPNVNLNLDVVCDWQRPVQKFLANVRAQYQTFQNTIPLAKGHRYRFEMQLNFRVCEQ